MRAKKMADIPGDWWRYYNQPVDWMTYYGDLHHGFIVESNDTDSFFLLSLNQAKEWRELENGMKTAEKLRTLSWEFKDARILQPIPNLPKEFGEPATNYGPSRFLKWKYKKLFIFGAGASSFCCFGDEAKRLKQFDWRPPLATELFDRRFDSVLEKYPGAEMLIPDFESKGKDIEAAMEIRWKKIRDHYSPEELARYINTQFYLRDLTECFSVETKKSFRRENLYRVLADRLSGIAKQRPDVGYSLVTFNYDTLLDDALSEYCGMNLSYMNGYVPLNDQPFMLLKPHGSWNWGWPLPVVKRTAGWAAELYQQEVPLSQIYFEILGDLNSMVYRGSWGNNRALNKYGLGKHEVHRGRLQVFPPESSQPYFPALLVPLQDKDEFLMPYWHDHHLKIAFEEAEVAFLIGWKGGEDLFMRQLKQKAKQLKRIVIVNPEVEAVKAMISRWLNLEDYQIDAVPYFDDFVINHLDNELIA
jgi:hypothetical protein